MMPPRQHNGVTAMMHVARPFIHLHHISVFSLQYVNKVDMTLTLQVEMSRDINIVLPLIVANFVAKCFADLLSKPLYKYQLEAKSLPYLDSELIVSLENEL